jgi:hypothetical protein
MRTGTQPFDDWRGAESGVTLESCFERISMPEDTTLAASSIALKDVGDSFVPLWSPRAGW